MYAMLAGQQLQIEQAFDTKLLGQQLQQLEPWRTLPRALEQLPR
jgi:hypothetical protein